ncbi:MAG: helix-turn-helix transcriptional regulator [Colwellia sp.]|nr:helix-turn-helix transcriptional regulator [Colwellia sp.]
MHNKKHSFANNIAYTGFRQAPPSINLQPYIQCYWQINTELAFMSPSTELLHPNGGLGIIINFGSPLLYEGKNISSSGYMDGIHTKTRQMSLAGHIDAIGIRFNPGGASHFFATPLSEINNSNINLHDLAMGQLMESCQDEKEKNPTGDMLKFVDTFLLKKLTEPLKTDALVQHIAIKIKLNNGKNTIAETINDVGKSYRQIERLFKDSIGMTPKKYARIIRMENARTLLKNKNLQSFTEIGEVAGFYDQAHFIREFKSIIGLSPTAYINFKKKY